MPASTATHDPQSVAQPNNGLTLRALLDQRRTDGRPMSLDEAISVMVPVCIDLQERHARGEKVYVHPSCITQGADGLCRLEPALAHVPVLPRDRACMAPELQARLEPGDARASVFAVGAALYEALTSAPIGPAMRRPREIDPTLPEALEILLSKALVADRIHRPDDLGALASALHHIAPMKSVHPPEVDPSRLDKHDDFEVDIRLSMLPPNEMPAPPSIPRAASMPRIDIDPLNQVIDRTAPRSVSGATSVLLALKARLESDPRPRYVVNKDKMDHGPFSAVELLQQLASHTFLGEDLLRDELSGQTRPILEWEEFSPFAEQTALSRQIVAEKKEVVRVERAEKKSGIAKILISGGIVAGLAVAVVAFFLIRRGARNDDVDIADDQAALDLNMDGGLKGGKRAHGGRGGSRGGVGGGPAGGGNFTSGMSYEAALNSNHQEISIGGPASGPDLSDGQLGAPLKNGSFIGACGAPDSMKITVKVAVKMGRAVGVSVYTNPSNGGVSSCIDHAVRNLSWPSNPKMDTMTTSY